MVPLLEGVCCLLEGTMVWLPSILHALMSLSTLLLHLRELHSLNYFHLPVNKKRNYFTGEKKEEILS